MEIKPLDRNQFKLIASGKYLDVNKSYNQEQHQQYVDGAMFAFDLIQLMNRRGFNEQGIKEPESPMAAKQL